MSGAATAERTAVLRAGPISVRVEPRSVLVCLVLLLLTVLVALLALGSGDVQIPVREVIASLSGQGSGLREIIVVQWRLPRVLSSLVFGAALGASGAVFQSLTRNPLGSPDIIGFNTGAYTGALVVMLVIGGSFGLVAVGALTGGLATALIVYLLAYRGGTDGVRLILVGIGISAMLASVNHWLVLWAELDAAMSAAVWGAGSLNGIRWPQAAPAIGIVLVLLVVTALLGRHLSMLELGDDLARGLGLRTERTRLVLLVVGVCLTAAVTAVAGPIAFVALAAPQLAVRLTGGVLSVVPAACMGALVLTASDLAAQRLFAPTQLPVGVVTVCAGGGYLLWLLYREARR